MSRIEIDLVTPVLIVLQAGLLILHWGNSNILGVQWNSLPWTLVWFPTLIVVGMAIFALFIFLIAIIIDIHCSR